MTVGIPSTFNSRANFTSEIQLTGSAGTAGQVLTSAGTGAAPTWTTVSGTGTVTSVGGTGTVNGLTLTGTVTSSGNLTLGGTLNLDSPPKIGATTANEGAFTVMSSTSGIVKSLTTGGGRLDIVPSNVSNTVSMNLTAVDGGDGALIIDSDGPTGNSFTFAGADFFPSQGSTTMVNGFVFIPGGNGAPTGTPTTTNAGIRPMYYDQTADELYIYNSGSWKHTTFNNAYADMYVNAGTTSFTTSATANTFTKLTSFTTAGLANSATISIPNSTITVTNTGVYQISFFNAFNGQNNRTFSYRVYNETTATPYANTNIQVQTTTTDPTFIGYSAIISINAGEAISIQIASSGTTDTITPLDANLSILRVN